MINLFWRAMFFLQPIRCLSFSCPHPQPSWGWGPECSPIKEPPLWISRDRARRGEAENFGFHTLPPICRRRGFELKSPIMRGFSPLLLGHPGDNTVNNVWTPLWSVCMEEFPRHPSRFFERKAKYSRGRRKLNSGRDLYLLSRVTWTI